MNKERKKLGDYIIVSKDKSALSTVVTTLIIIGLALVVIGVVWFTIDKFLSESAEGVSLAKFMETGELGACAKDSDCGIDGWVEGSGFCEGEDLWQNRVEYNCDRSRCGVTTTSELKETCETCVDGECSEGGGGNGTGGGECNIDLDCGIDFWIDGSERCVGEEVWKYQEKYTCDFGNCNNNLALVLKEDCTESEEICSEGNCIEEVTTCVENPDCGTDGWINGPPVCVDDQLWQDWKEYICTDGECSSIINHILKEDCATQDQICFGGTCFEVVDCVQNEDCGQGEVCDLGECVIETPVNSGLVLSSWPAGLGLYFDSHDLPTEIVYYMDYFVRFSGEEIRCLKVAEYTYPDFLEYDSYIRLDTTVSNVHAGDNYEIWETLYGCENL